MTGDRFFDSVRSLGITRHDDTPLAGVCAGLAERWNVDPLLVRALTVAVAFLGGAGVTLYAIGWLLLPDKTERIHAQEPFYGKISASFIVAIILIFIPLSTVGVGPYNTGLAFGSLGFFITLIIVAVLLLRMYDKEKNAPPTGDSSSRTSETSTANGDSASAFTGSARQSATPPGDRAAGYHSPLDHAADDSAAAGSEPGVIGGSGPGESTSASWQGLGGARGGHAGEPSNPSHTGSDRPWLNPDGPGSRDRSHLYATVSEDLDWADRRPAASSRAVLLTMAFLLTLTAVVAFMLDQDFVPLADTNVALGAFAGATVVLGIVVIIYGATGQRGGGMSAIAIIVAALTFPVAALVSLPSAEHHVLMGERSWAPTSAGESAGDYSVLMGSLEVDVSDLDEAQFEVFGRLSDITVIVGDDQNVAVVTDYVMSDISGTDGRSDTSGVSGDTTYFTGETDSVDEADIVIHVDVIMSDFNLERQS